MDVNTLKWIQLIQTIVLFVLPALVVAWFVGKKHPIAWLRLNRGVRWTTAILAMVMVVVAIPGINLLSYLNQQMQLPACLSGLEAWMQQQEEAAAYVTELMVHADTVWMLLLNIGLMAVLPAFGEELTFRGALQGWIGGVTEEKRITTRQHVAVWIVAVLFDADGNAKLVDFGLAAMQGESNEIWGTPYYISPEKVRRQKIDYRADIYSLGGTLYHALTGVAPFEGEDATEVVKARFNGPPKKPSEVRPDLPPEVDPIIMRMLEVEPSMRYPTYQSLLGDFKRFLSKAGPAKTSKMTSPKVKIKGTKINMKLTADEKAPAPMDVADLEPIDGEEVDGKKGMNPLAIVGMVAGGVVPSFFSSCSIIIFLHLYLFYH